MFDQVFIDYAIAVLSLTLVAGFVLQCAAFLSVFLPMPLLIGMGVLLAAIGFVIFMSK